MPGGSSDGVITSSPPVFSPQRRLSFIQQSMESCQSSSSSSMVTDSRLNNLSKMYMETRDNLSDNELVTLEARLVRLIASLINDDIGGVNELTQWLTILGMSEKECIDMVEIGHIYHLSSFVSSHPSQLVEICDRLGVNEETIRRLLISTEKIKRLLHIKEGVSSPSSSSSSSSSTILSDDQLSWSIPYPSADGFSSQVRNANSSIGGGSSINNRSTNNSPTIDSPTRSSSSPSGMARVAVVKSSTSRYGCDSSSSCGQGPSSTLCPPSPLNLTTTTITASPTLSAVPKGRQRVIQSSSMHFGSGTRSPKATRFHHEIPHQWIRRSTFRFTENSCALCRRPLGFGFLNTWEKCKSCKMKVHTHCKTRTGDTCGLTPDHLRALFDDMVQQGNSDAWGMGPQSANITASRSLNEPAFQYPDNAAVILDSSSSTNSSAPSTPALANGAQSSPYGPMCRSAIASDRGKFFTFPDSVPEVPDIVLHTSTEDTVDEEGVVGEGEGGVNEPSIGLTGSQDSQCTIRQNEGGDGGGGRPPSLIVDSQGSYGDGSITSELSPGGHTWDRTKWNMSTIRGASGQNSWSEVTIPYNKIEFKKNRLIGNGRFGQVVRGYHFGDVAVKFLNMDHVEDGDRLEHFKAEVASFKNTRHDNIVLCLGYCLDQTKLGIVMGLCKGRTLHSIIHGPNEERVDMASAIKYATEICQGVSYLHQKKIIHKDLRTKNIFIESKQKAVITDLGIFSMQRLRYPERTNSILVPNHWLAYLAPELIRGIAGDLRELTFTEHTDVFAFGTIWYELLTSSIPFNGLHPDQIIYSVGKGISAPLHNIPTIREVKDILMRSWSFNASDRPSFLTCHTLLHNLPKKRLDRSPSYPMVRSYESIF